MVETKGLFSSLSNLRNNGITKNMNQKSENAGIRIISGIVSALASLITCLIIGCIWLYIVISTMDFSDSWLIFSFAITLLFNLILSILISLIVGMTFGQSHGLRLSISIAVIIGSLISNIIYIWWGWSSHIF